MDARTISARRFRINVTQAHIDRGRRGSCSYCPIALAATDSPDCPGRLGVLGVYDIGVGIYEIVIIDRTDQHRPTVWRGPLDDHMQEFIRNFDRYERPYEPKPFSTEITLTPY